MKDFQDLLALALVGTSRGSLPHHAGTPLSDTLNALQGDPESILLSRAALAGLVNFAGQSAEPLQQDIPAPAPPETLREAPSRVTRHLSALIGTPMLGEWLRLCAQAGWRVPAEHLPALLDLTRTDTALREHLRPVLGERGVWLAQFNPEWRFTPSAFDEDAWLDATEAQKESMYRDLRHRNPEGSREVLTQQFKTEKAGSRKRLLNVLQDTWQPEDAALEPLLDDALNDRSSEVQATARALLKGIPGSAYNARMAARAARMLQPENTGLVGKLMGKQTFSLHLPDDPDPDAGRDGLPTPGKDTRNPVHQRFRALLGRTYTSTLLATLNISPKNLVTLAVQVDGLSELQAAAITSQQREVAQALLQRPEIEKDKYVRAALYMVAQPDRIADEIRNQIRHNNLDTLEFMLDGLPAPWPDEVTHDLLNLLRNRALGITDSHSHNYMLNRLLERVSHKASPLSPRPEPCPIDEENLHYYAMNARQSFNSTLTTLEQRQQLWQDFQESRR